MAMAAQLGPALHAQSAKLGSFQGFSRASKGCAVVLVTPPHGGGASSRRFVAVRAANESTIRAAKKGAPPIMPAVLTPSGPVDLNVYQLPRWKHLFNYGHIRYHAMAASQGALLLAGRKKGKHFAMPNARIMIHQPQGGCGETADDVRRQVNKVMSSWDKIDQMYSFVLQSACGNSAKIHRARLFFSAAEAMDFGLIDDLLETEF